MTPDDLTLIRQDAEAIDPVRFAPTFYQTLFELAPGVRPLFPSDLTDQQRKLTAELMTMVSMAVDLTDGSHERFVERAQRLGARHVEYGATIHHYGVVGTALITALASAVDGWDDRHHRAWSRLYATVSATMLEGTRPFED